MSLRVTIRPGHPDFLDLPWEEPLDSWHHPRLADVVAGIHRHVVRFVAYGERTYALKELPERAARREERMLRELLRRGVPVVEVVGLVDGRTDRRGEPIDDVLITRHLDFSLPYRAVFSRGATAEPVNALIDAQADLLVRIHLAGFFWGDCSLSNTLFRRDAGALAAYLVDAETGELHDRLSDGQRAHDLLLARENVAGELLDLVLAGQAQPGLDPAGVSEALAAKYERLWDELDREETIEAGERHRIEARIRRLNDLGYDVEEVRLVEEPDGCRLRLQTRVVEPGHHRRRLLAITGLDVQENQARRLLNDIRQHQARLAQTTPFAVSEEAAARRWAVDVFEPTLMLVPAEHAGKLEPAELYHQILEHRWFLSEAQGRDVGTEEAVASYVADVLQFMPGERAVLGDGP